MSGTDFVDDGMLVVNALCTKSPRPSADSRSFCNPEKSDGYLSTCRGHGGWKRDSFDDLDLNIDIVGLYLILGSSRSWRKLFRNFERLMSPELCFPFLLTSTYRPRW